MVLVSNESGEIAVPFGYSSQTLPFKNNQPDAYKQPLKMDAIQ